MNTDGEFNTAVGYFSMMNNINGVNNVAYGSGALFVNNADNNTAIGAGALGENTNGTNNTCVGGNVMAANISGSSNTAVGLAALVLANGSNNIAVGFGAGSVQTTGTGNIYIDHVGVAAESNVIRIGTAQTTCFIQGISGATSAGGTEVFINGSGQLGVNTSSIRYKENIEDMNEISSAIFNLRPVIFNYIDDAEKISQAGLIAEEVEQIMPRLAVYKDGQIETVKYRELSVLLLNEAIKERKERIELQTMYVKLRDDMVNMRAELDKIKNN